jgi:hypothetical protein
MPEYLHKKLRREEIVSAILQYTNAGIKIPIDWFYEYNAISEFMLKAETTLKVKPE